MISNKKHLKVEITKEIKDFCKENDFTYSKEKLAGKPILVIKDGKIPLTAIPMVDIAELAVMFSIFKCGFAAGQLTQSREDADFDDLLKGL
jgi:hypothetical protein